MEQKDVDKLGRFDDMTRYYRILLKMFSDRSDGYNISQEEKELLNDKELRNQFLIDATGMILSRNHSKHNANDSNTNSVGVRPIDKKKFNELFRNVEFNANLYNDDNNTRVPTDSEILDIVYQVRNCFAHGLVHIDGDDLVYDGAKVKGKIPIKKVVRVSEFVDNFDKAIDSFEDYYLDNPIEAKQDMDSYLIDLTRVKTNGMIVVGNQFPITDEEKLNDFIQNGIYLDFENTNYSDRMLIFKDFLALYNKEDNKKCSAQELTELYREEYGKDDIKIKSIRDYSDVIRGYVNYIGSDTFYRLNTSDQIQALNKSAFYESIEMTGDDVKSLITFMQTHHFDDSDFALDGKRENYIAQRPFLFESALKAYMFNRLLTLKEWHSSRQIDRSIIDYSQLDYSKMTYLDYTTNTQKQNRKTKLERTINNHNNDIQGIEARNLTIKNSISGINLAGSNGNSIKAAKQQEIIDNNKKIAEKKGFRDEKQTELDYLNRNSKSGSNNPFYIIRTLRSGIPHEFKFYNRARAYSNGDLKRIKIAFNSNVQMARVSVKLRDLLDFISQIEEQVSSKIEQFKETHSVLSSAVDATRKSVSSSSMVDTAKQLIGNVLERDNGVVQEENNVNETR